MEILEKKKNPKQKVRRPPCTWHGPEPGVIKLNSDGSIRDELGVAGGGGVARKENGFVSAWCRSYQYVTDPLTIEALALRDAVVFATQQGYQKVIFESDCEELVRLWKERASHRSVIAPILSEIDEIRPSFRWFDLCFAGRTANKVAHACAKFACEHRINSEWIGSCPDFLRLSLEADCKNLVLK